MLKALLKKTKLVYNAKQMIYAVSIALDNLLHFPPIQDPAGTSLCMQWSDCFDQFEDLCFRAGSLK